MISVVIPCFNERDVLGLTYDALCRAAASWDEPIEILLVDDGSDDETWTIIAELAARDVRVRGLRLSRNFGQQAALGAGFEQARGDAVLVLDADLQDPPELVPQMVARWREGYHVVSAQRRRRQGESALKRWTASLYYRLLDRISDVSIQRDTGDFALLDAAVVRHLVACPEQALYWRGLRSWLGFRHATVRFDRPARAAGETKYSIPKMLRLAADGLLAYSHFPLRLPTQAGLLVVAATMLLVLLATGSALWAGRTLPWAQLQTLSLWFLGGVQLLCLGLIGQYLQRIYDEVRRRPRWIVSETTATAARDTAPFSLEAASAGITLARSA